MLFVWKIGDEEAPAHRLLLDENLLQVHESIVAAVIIIAVAPQEALCTPPDEEINDCWPDGEGMGSATILSNKTGRPTLPIEGYGFSSLLIRQGRVIDLEQRPIREQSNWSPIF